MGIQFSELKKINTFISFLYPKVNFEKRDFNRKNCEMLVQALFFMLDALIKSENLYKKRNLILPEDKSYLTDNLIFQMENLNLYLNKFDTKIFNFTRTEHQTFIFIIENLIDYFKNNEQVSDKKDKEKIFLDYRFWFDNFLRIISQKILGSFYSSKNTNLKVLFDTEDASDNELIYSNASVSFSLSPFIIVRGNQRLFLVGIIEEGLAYKEFDEKKKHIISHPFYLNKVFEFFISNFQFELANLIKGKVNAADNIVFSNLETIQNSYDYHKQKLFNESHALLKDKALETLNLPLVDLLQIRNLVNLNRIFEVKKIMQKFILYYPFYIDAFEIMGDIYSKEENFEMALNFYEKVLKINQNKRVTEKVKKVKEFLLKSKKINNQSKSEYDYDITEIVFNSEDEFIGRDRQLREMIEILISNSRNNIVLVGESGVGKTSLIKFLAQKIMSGGVPEILKDKRIKEINFVSLLTGSKYRGQFEEKVLKFLADFKAQNSILILEDIHLMMSTGVARGTALDLVNILKSFLRENSIQVIATTNYEDYKNTLEKDNSLLVFFQKITVNELSQENAKLVLANMAKRILLKDNLLAPDRILENIVESAKTSIREKRLPDSAILLFERCLAKTKYKIFSGESDRMEVTDADLTEVLSDVLNLPESNVSVSLKSRLLKLRSSLWAEIVGQEEALERISANIIASKLNYDIKKNRPDGVFLFIGPTGVGKTETAIALAKALYGSEDYLIRIDMSEYMEKFTYSRFIGAAPGYVGYYDSNQLTDKVRQNPFSVILLDEVEKADSQLLNIFLQVFDAGRLTDARGNVVDFSHATIIMTSNIGTSLFSKIQMGYQSDLAGGKVSNSAMVKALKRFFSLEFLNRVDEVIHFKHLETEEVKKIIEIQLRGIRSQLEKQEKELIVREEVIDYIVKNGYSREYGARNIARFMKKNLLEKMAQISLDREWDEAKTIICTCEKDQVEMHLESHHDESLGNSNLIEQLSAK